MQPFEAGSGPRRPGLYQPDDEALRAEGFVRYETPSPFVNFIGGCWQRSDASRRTVDVALRVLPEHCNTHGTLHGGMALVLADQVLAMTSKLLTRRNGVTMHVDADLLASAPRGSLVRGRARILKQTGSTAFVEAHLHTVTTAQESEGESAGESAAENTGFAPDRGEPPEPGSDASAGASEDAGIMVLRCSGVVRLLAQLDD